MLRHVIEAVFIKELNPELNTKEEWGNSNAKNEYYENTKIECNSH